MTVKNKSERDATASGNFISVNALPLAYFSLSQHGIITNLNSEAVDLLGYPKDALLKHHVSSVFATDSDSDDVGRLLVSEVMQGKEIKDLEVQMVRSDGSKVWVSITASIISQNGGPPMIGLMATDIDRRKFAESRARSERERASLVLEVMTHDLNNVNQSLIFSLGLLGESQRLNRTGSNLLNASLEEVRRASRMISNLRDIFALSEAKVETESLDLNECLNSVIRDVRNEFDSKSLVVTSNIEERQFILEGYDLLHKAFYNILHNSMQFDQSEEVHVKITAKHIPARGKIRIEFEDNGPGVPDSLKPFIFKRSGSPDFQIVGRGLGLTLTDRILEKIGGEVWVEDKVEGDFTKGARFVMMVPSWNMQKTLECGKTSCITFYKSNHCLFCEPTYEVLTGVMEELGIPASLLTQINVDDPASGVKEKDLPMVPYTRICKTDIVGFADVEDVRVALMNLLMTPCYPY